MSKLYQLKYRKNFEITVIEFEPLSTSLIKGVKHFYSDSYKTYMTKKGTLRVVYVDNDIMVDSRGLFKSWQEVELELFDNYRQRLYTLKQREEN